MRRNFSRALENAVLVKPQDDWEKARTSNQEVSQEDRSVCKGAQVEPEWLGQSCGGGGGAGQQQALLDLFTQKSQKSMERSKRQEDVMPFCTANMAWLERRQAERSPPGAIGWWLAQW